MTKTRKPRRRIRTVTNRCVVCKERKRMMRSTDICPTCYKKGHRKTNKNRNEKIVSILEKEYKELFEDLLDRISAEAG